jgi:hypothetical protein
MRLGGRVRRQVHDTPAKAVCKYLSLAPPYRGYIPNSNTAPQPLKESA